MAGLASNAASVKIFWPDYITFQNERSGYLLGWNIRSFIVTVATVVSGVPATELERRLAAYAQTAPTATTVQPVVLGVWINPNEEQRRDDPAAPASGPSMQLREWARQRQTANLWMEIEGDREALPFVRAVYSCGYKYRAASTELVLYTRPDPRKQQFYSMSPLVLDASQPGPELVARTSAPGAPRLPAREATASPVTRALVSSFRNILVGKPHNGQLRPLPPAPDADPATVRRLQLHTAPATKVHGRPGLVQEFDAIVQQINNAIELERAVLTATPAAASAAAPSGGSAAGPPATTWLGRIKVGVQLFVVDLLVAFTIVLRIITQVLMAVLQMQLPAWPFSSVRIMDISATAMQLHLRMLQMRQWPWQVTYLRHNVPPASHAHAAQYIHYHNTIWLVLNDIIFGIVLGHFLRAHADTIGHMLAESIRGFTIDHVEMMVRWLMGWPSGIKLNNNLDAFFGNVCLTFLAIWRVPHALLLDSLPAIVSAVGTSGMFGATMMLSLAVDVLALLSVHIWILYSAAAAIYNWQLNNLISLFHLFRGKKRNVLRHRIDACDYDQEQLLLGTVLFTVLIFLLPTTAAYYCLFSMLRVQVIAMEALLETVLALLNHFPLFSLMLKVKDPLRLPGGIYFQPGPLERLRRRSYSRWARALRAMLGAGSLYFTQGRLGGGAPAPSDSGGAPRRRPGHSKSASVGSWDTSGMPGGPQVAYLAMRVRGDARKQSRSVPISHIFFQYIRLGQRLTMHFKPQYIIECLLFGRPVEPVCKLQYPVLPERDPPFAEFMDVLQALQTSFAP